ncbi:DUF6402 family protein [Photorhabdus heterorhabditis]|uniref:DUF6402 family protein n=1 Tax=Photorhabdus heterorhabditis TaxID=880156 RepID=UPI001561AFD7|nr:DUF6402 family protein [Photorhabdus heterorhabditis]NRN28777.1 hypothetical protein [Photorhabdus heterorhabditis subsp. aluminescens]
MSILKTKTVKGGENTEIEMDIFYLNQIPDAMEKMGWEMAPKLMRHWFNTKPAYAFTESEKTKLIKQIDAIDIPKERVNDTIVKMDWALKYKQVERCIESLKNSWATPNGINLLKKRLKNSKDRKIGYYDSILEIDSFSTVNYESVGGLLDTIDDWYAAIGKATIKIAVRGRADKLNNKDVFVNEAIGFYIKDSYDFVGNEEFLGVWSKNGILSKAKSALFKGYYDAMQWKELAGEYSGYVPIQNLDFRAWQRKHNEGGDFIVFSDILWMPPINKHKVIIL